jgi:hypothetical protein
MRIHGLGFAGTFRSAGSVGEFPFSGISNAASLHGRIKVNLIRAVEAFHVLLLSVSF